MDGQRPGAGRAGQGRQSPRTQARTLRLLFRTSDGRGRRCRAPSAPPAPRRDARPPPPSPFPPAGLRCNFEADSARCSRGQRGPGSPVSARRRFMAVSLAEPCSGARRGWSSRDSCTCKIRIPNWSHSPSGKAGVLP